MDTYDRNEKIQHSLKKQQTLNYTLKYLKLMNSATENQPAFKIEMNFREEIKGISRFIL